jgi:hypothetical protein
MTYTNCDKFTDHLITIWEESDNETESTDSDYEPDSNDDGFYDRFYDGY